MKLEGKRAQRRHVQEAHRDILKPNLEAAQERRRCTELREQLLNQIRTAKVRGVRIKPRTDLAPGNTESEVGGIELNPDNSQVTVDFPVETPPLLHDNDISPAASLKPVVPEDDVPQPALSRSAVPEDGGPQHDPPRPPRPVAKDETTRGRPSLDQRLADIEEGVEESEIQAVTGVKQEGPRNPKKPEKRLQKERHASHSEEN